MSLALTYRIIWQLREFHNYSIDDVYELIPYERDIFIDMHNDHEEKKQQEYEILNK